MRAPLLAVLTVVTLARVATAQPAPTVRAEARSRFDRGITFFDEGDHERALAEFRRAYEIAPNARVLYNIGLVLTAAGRPAEATEALEQVVANPGDLKPAELRAVRGTLEIQRQKVAELTVTANVAGARIAVDAAPAGQTPLASPLRVGSGKRIVTVEAPGYAPLRKEITIAGGVRQAVDFQLVPLEGRLAHLAFRVPLPDVDLYAEGQRVARTPLETTLTFPPGPLHVELRRDGYRTASRTIELGDGATGEIAAELEVDETTLGAQGGSLHVTASEPRATFKVDGHLVGLVGRTVRVPKGRHEITVQQGGFEPSRRLVTVPVGGIAELRARLEPTPETRLDYESSARTRRTASFVVMGAGLAVAAGGAVLTAVGHRNVSSNGKAYADLVAQYPKGGVCPAVECVARGDDFLAKQSNARALRGIGVAVLSVGVVGLGVGAVLWLTGNDVHRYDARRSYVPTATASGVSWQF